MTTKSEYITTYVCDRCRKEERAPSTPPTPTSPDFNKVSPSQHNALEEFNKRWHFVEIDYSRIKYHLCASCYGQFAGSFMHYHLGLNGQQHAPAVAVPPPGTAYKRED